MKGKLNSAVFSTVHHHSIGENSRNTHLFCLVVSVQFNKKKTSFLMMCYSSPLCQEFSEN